MSQPYQCPNCKSNKSRFNLFEQTPNYVKLDPNSGDMVLQYTDETLEPFHVKYQGPKVRVQCGVCGLMEDEIRFIKQAELQKKQ
ncbi:DNA alkylation repair protein [Sediminibacillus massiliensis]|uniref:DNA alkylation repair protein n=1 Tax=Sediminibacillus massiliensis TaxID=1926277 RepID=UPI0009885AE8|nr:DNA alkylation repair protein [Sediminibacillus massiliensis]